MNLAIRASDHWLLLYVISGISSLQRIMGRFKQIMKKLKNGWVEGSVQEFLELSDADVEYIETRRALSRLLREVRTNLQLSQVQLAARLKTSQSRVAKMEKADLTVSVDLLLKALFRMGVKRKQLANAI